jgi:hypothetical protein
VKLETYTLPAYWASYIVNGDASGLEDGEQQEIDNFCTSCDLGDCLDMANEDEFSWHNDANNLGGSTAEFTFEELEHA